MNHTLENRLSAIRSAPKLTTRAFAEQINISAVPITNMEKGRRIITERTISSICKTFNVNEEWLRYGVGRIENMFNKSDDDILKNVEHILKGENKLHKNLFKMLAQFDQTDLDSIERMMNKFLEVKNQEISVAIDTTKTKETLEEKIDKEAEQFKGERLLEEKTQTSSALQSLKEKRA